LDLPTLEADLAHQNSEIQTTVPLEVHPGTQSGDTLTVKGYGVPRLRGTGRGDLHVQVIVETPARLTDEQRDLLTQLAALRDEDKIEGQFSSNHKGVFGRIKDAFK
ncbi:MAG: DnaJ C-terminal domain-containing protein, partial [Aeromicrobium sp.]